jgi:hypothetical protein
VIQLDKDGNAAQVSRTVNAQRVDLTGDKPHFTPLLVQSDTSLKAASGQEMSTTNGYIN